MLQGGLGKQVRNEGQDLLRRALALVSEDKLLEAHRVSTRLAQAWLIKKIRG